MMPEEAVFQYYLQKNNGDYESADKEVKSLNISKIDVAADGSIFITTDKIGRIIGPRGANIYAMIKFLGVKVRLFESKGKSHDSEHRNND